jgi:hypothetical protein
MEYIKDAIIKILGIEFDESYVIRIPKKFKNKKQYLDFVKRTNKFIETNVKYD